MKLNNKGLLALGAVLILGAYAWLLRDWFSPTPLKISHRVFAARPLWVTPRSGNNPPPDAPLVTFGFDRKLKLSDVKVFLLPELETNKLAQPIWHLVADTNGFPVKGFSYGVRFRGMKPFVKGSRPLPLTTGVPYRLFIEAGSLRGQHDFSLGETNPNRISN